MRPVLATQMIRMSFAALTRCTGSTLPSSEVRDDGRTVPKKTARLIRSMPTRTFRGTMSDRLWNSFASGETGKNGTGFLNWWRAPRRGPNKPQRREKYFSTIQRVSTFLGRSFSALQDGAVRLSCTSASQFLRLAIYTTISSAYTHQPYPTYRSLKELLGRGVDR